jgi:hypothetical protein
VLLAWTALVVIVACIIVLSQGPGDTCSPEVFACVDENALMTQIVSAFGLAIWVAGVPLIFVTAWISGQVSKRQR